MQYLLIFCRVIVSMLPVVATQSSPTKGTNADDKSPTMRNKRVTSSKIPVCLEKSVHGTGDCKRPSSTPGRCAIYMVLVFCLRWRACSNNSSKNEHFLKYLLIMCYRFFVSKSIITSLFELEHH